MPRTEEQKKKYNKTQREQRKRQKEALQKKQQSLQKQRERQRNYMAKKRQQLQQQQQQQQERATSNMSGLDDSASTNPSAEAFETPRRARTGGSGQDSSAATVAGIGAISQMGLQFAQSIERSLQAQRQHEFESAESQRKHELEMLDKQIKLETVKKSLSKKPRFSADKFVGATRKLDVEASDDDDDDDDDQAAITISTDYEDDDQAATINTAPGFLVGDKIKWTKEGVEYKIVRVNKNSYRVSYTNPWTDENVEKTVELKGKYKKHDIVKTTIKSKGVVTSVAHDEIGLEITHNDEKLEVYAGKAEWPELLKLSPPASASKSKGEKKLKSFKVGDVFELTTNESSWLPSFFSNQKTQVVTVVAIDKKVAPVMCSLQCNHTKKLFDVEAQTLFTNAERIRQSTAQAKSAKSY